LDHRYRISDQTPHRRKTCKTIEMTLSKLFPIVNYLTIDVSHNSSGTRQTYWSNLN
jgi:hypothetical protein